MVCNFKTKEQGFALLLSMVVASVLLALGLGMLSITSKQLTLSGVARESETAFAASAAGMECIRFYRRANGSTYVTNGASAPQISCFSTTDNATYRSESTVNQGGTGFINVFNYQLEWGSGTTARCSEIDLYLMVTTSGGGGMTYDFDTAYGIEAVGSKTCNDGDTCTVAVSRGFNKSCTQVGQGLATVQRELTAQF